MSAFSSQSKHASSPDLPSRLTFLRDRLLHITARNPSIMLATLPKRRGLDLGHDHELAATTIRRVLSGRSSCIVPDRDTSPEASEARARLVAMRRHLHLQREETGLESGHLGFPFLTGKLDQDTWVRGPLLLLPIDIEHRPGSRPGGWHASLREGAHPAVNKALLAAVAKVQDTRIQDTLIDGLEDLVARFSDLPAGEFDLDQLLADMEDLLQQHGILAPLMDGATQALAPMTKEDRATQNAPLHLARHVVMGDFPQANEPIHADYDGLIAAADGDGMELLKHLLDLPADLITDVEVPHVDAVADNDIGNVLAANGKQTDVVLRARATPCTVIRGPPGTGKSQVITNLVTDALRHGQRVLVVCQKRAALDVVHERLRQAGLDDICLLVHDPNADRKAAFQALARLIDGPTPGVPDLRPLCDEVDRLVDDLDAIVEVFGQTHRGKTIHEIHAEADPDHTVRLAGHRDLHDVQWSDVERATAAIQDIGADVRRYRIDHVWAGRRDLGHDAPRRADVEERLDRLRDELERPYHIGPRKDLEADLHAFTTWMAKRRSMLRRVDPEWRTARTHVQAFLSGVAASEQDAAEWAARIRQGLRVLDALDALDDVVGARMRNRITDDADHSLEVVAAWRDGCRDWETLVQVDRHLGELPVAARRLVLLGLREFGDAAAHGITQEVLAAWIAELEQEIPMLRGDPFHDHARKRDRLAMILNERRRRMADGIGTAMRELARNPTGDARAWNQAGALLRRKRRIPTMRQVLHDVRLGHVWDRAARCWLMSPEAVSAVHPLESGSFDLVVFDEGSQLAVERALPAIYRAKRIVVAGDEQQLPPFDLFRGQGEDDEPELETDSLLSLAQAAFGCHMLEWHYRSEHQELVEFSNQAYYGGGLKVVPNPDHGARPIRYHRVEGRFVDRRNRVEADAIVDILADLLSRPEPPSVGVVTFNQPQRELIEERIDARCEVDTEFAADWARALQADADGRPFIKNIENVQGDERDVMVFSTTYGPDAEGKLSNRFGVFNQRGGEHRLNVAITRARSQVHVVTSMDPEDLQVESSTHLGPKHLRAYLEYARAVDRGDRGTAEAVLARVAEGTQRSGRASPPTSMHRRLCQALEDEGYVAKALVGYSGYRIDIAVATKEDPERFLVAVELDGPNFRAAHGARERDVQRQEFLESRGWSVVRVWSRNWLHDPDKQVRRIVGAVERARLAQ